MFGFPVDLNHIGQVMTDCVVYFLNISIPANNRYYGCITFAPDFSTKYRFYTMKKLVILIAFTGLFACQQQKNEISRLGMVRDSLSAVTSEKDQAIMDFLSSFNEIQENLDSIKALEKMITVASQQPGELQGDRKQQILEDIALLNQLIQKNKELNSSLQRRLNSANSKVGELQGMVTEFERMVSNLNSQVEQKNIEISQLTQNVEKLNIDVSQLSSQVQEVTRTVEEKTRIIDDQTVAMNKVYYAMGTVRELTDNNILEKSGGVLGVGRTLKIRRDFNRDYFTTTDMRGFTYLPLMAKKAKIISVHPSESFRISGEKTADTLFINNPQEFWKASKYLLIVID
jgi:myosin heavy subunit